MWDSKAKKRLQVQHLIFEAKIAPTIIVGSQIVAHTQMETGDGPNKPNTINL